MLADIPERQIAHIHPMNDERAGYSQDVGGIVGTELLVLREYGYSVALEEMAESGLKQGRCLRWKPHDLVPARRLAADADFDPIALAEIGKALGRLAILI